MSNKIGHMEIAGCFENAWQSLLRDYSKNGRFRFRGESAERAAELFGHYWTERDVHARLAVLMMNEVSKISRKKGREAQVSLDFQLRRKYHQILEGKWLRGSRIVDIVAFIPSEGQRNKPFKLFAEVKYFPCTYSCKPHTISAKWIEKDIEKLSALLDKQICRVAYFCFLDEYYTNNPETRKTVRQFLDVKEGETGVKCLYDGIGYDDWVMILKRRKSRS